MNKYTIKSIQIDVNGLCNAGCWFCPVSYKGNPKSGIKDMELFELENILKQLKDGMGNFVDPSLKNIFSAHYNEVLLYKNLEGMLELYRKYGFTTNILTNGVALKKDKVDLLNKYPDVVNQLLLNVPASESKRWSEYVKMNEKLFDKVIENIDYAIETLNHLITNNSITLMVNGIKNKSLTKNGGWLDLLDNAPKFDLDNESGTFAKDVLFFQTRFPDIRIFESYHLYDRTGQLINYDIMSQTNAIQKYLKPNGSRVIGCNGGIDVRSRTNEWVHINANCDTFICCNDYDFETIYGNTKNNSLESIWNSKERFEMVKKSYADMCTKCSAAIWGN